MGDLDFALTRDVEIERVTCIGLQQFAGPRDITSMVSKQLNVMFGIHRIASSLQRVCQIS